MRPLRRFLSNALSVLAIPGCLAAQGVAHDGQVVTVGSQSWWVSCAGTGSPLVLLEAGHNETGATWRAVEAEVATFTRVCSYDRAGLGRSAPPPAGRNRTGRNVVDELAALLSAVDPRSDIMLVGHSLGGAFVRLYASAYPSRVVGLVLVDAVHEREFAAIEELLTPAQRAAGADMRPLSPEGIDIEATLAAVRALPRPIAPELVVVARGVPLAANEMPPDWTSEQRQRREAVRVALQEDLARLSPRGRLIVARRSRHFVHHDEPGVVVDAIRSVVERARR